MILSDILNHFGIDEIFPDYLLNHPFNKVFLDGDLTRENDSYKIAVRTRQDVVHQMFLKPNSDFPVIILSVLPNGRQNGIKFGLNEGEEIPISQL